VGVEAIPRWVYTAGTMIKMTVNTNIDRYVKRYGPSTEKQFQTAILRTLNDVAFTAKKDLERYADSVFASPTPLTRNPALVKKAELTPTGAVARVKLKDKMDMATKGSGPAEYLRAQITGGKRRDKRSEALLQIKGYLPTGYQAAPTDAYQNRYGNISLGLIQKILSDLQSYVYSGSVEQNRPHRYRKPKLAGRAKYKTTKGNKTVGKYFVIPVFSRDGGRNRAPGIYERKGGRPIMVMSFFPAGTYSKNYDFHRSVASSVFKNFRRRFGYHFGAVQGK